MTTDAELVELIPNWLALTQNEVLDTGLGRAEAIELAENLLSDITAGGGRRFTIDADGIKDVLFALTYVVLPRRKTTLSVEVVSHLYKSVSHLIPAASDAEERRVLLRQLWVIGWKACGVEPAHVVSLRKHAGDTAPTGIHIVFPSASLGHLFNACAAVARDLERAPSRAARDATKALDSVNRNAGGLFDEKEYFRGELALMAGVAARFQGQVDVACHWFNQAERLFLSTLYPDVGLAKIAFARLAILYLNYRFEDLVTESKRLRVILHRLGMPAWAAKCRHVEAMAEKMKGRPGRAIELLRPLLDETSVAARPLFRVRVLSQHADSLVELGRHEEALESLRSAARLLEGTAPSASSADFWTILGALLSVNGRHSEAMEVFRRAKAQYASVEMRGLAAYTAVLTAEVALILGLPSDATRELRWAIPILRQEGRIPEGCAASALLEKSLKQEELDSLSVKAFRETIQRRNPSHS